MRLGGHIHADYATTVVDVEHHQIIDILPSRNYVDVAGLLDKQPKAWKERIRLRRPRHVGRLCRGVLGVLPKAAQVVDPFHVVSLANRASTQCAGECRTNRPVIADGATIPSIGREALLRGEERSTKCRGAVWSLLELGDPNAEVAIAYRVKERLRDFYRQRDPTPARALLEELVEHCVRRAMPPEVQKLGSTIRRWFDKICNFHLARMSNGPTEALNNLIKRIKRVGFGFRNFDNYRIRALLYAGKPNWRVLGSIVVR